MFWNLFRKKIHDTSALFSGHYMEIKAWYVLQFDRMPCLTFMSELNITKAYAFIREYCRHEITGVYQHRYFSHDENKMFFNNTVFILTENRMIEITANYCQVLHTNEQYEWASALVKDLAAFREIRGQKNETRVIGFARQEEMN